MKVSDIMTKNVMTVKRDTSVNEVAKLMGAHDISGVPVVDDENHVVGHHHRTGFDRAEYAPGDAALYRGDGLGTHSAAAPRSR